MDDADTLEKKLHNLFGEHRVNPKREFFRADPEKIVIAITIGQYREIDIAGQAGEAEDQKALETEKIRRSAH